MRAIPRRCLYFLLSLLLLSGCRFTTTTRSTVSTTAGNTTVKASFDGPAWIRSVNDEVVVQFGGRKLLVAGGSVQLDGKQVATLPAETKNVEIDGTRGVLTISADGREIKRLEF